MGFAQIAGLPIQAGLYAALVALLAYAVFGSSPQLKVETSASMAIISAAIVAPLALGDTSYYVTLSAALALVVGLLLIAAGLARLSFIADFLAQPIVLGFLFGIAVIVIIGQLPNLFGITLDADKPLAQIWELITSLGETNPWTLAISVSAFLILIMFKRFLPKLPGVLFMLLFGVAVGFLLNLEQHGVDLVGFIPSGLPSFKFPLIQLKDLIYLTVGAVSMVFVALADSLGTARAFAAENHYQIDPDQELLAIGAANVGAGLFQGFSVGANSATTSSANSAKVKTQLASIVTTLLIVGTLATQIEMLSYLPEAVLSVAVIMAVSHMLKTAELRRYYATRRIDFMLAIVTLVGVLVTDILTGLLIAVFLSLAIVLYRSSRPHLAVMGKIPDRKVFGDIEKYPEAEPVWGLLLLRLDTALYFANANTALNEIKDQILKYDDSSTTVIIDLGASADLDIASLDMLYTLLNHLEERNIRLALANVHSETRARLEQAGLMDKIGSKKIYLDMAEAVEDLNPNL
jgi:high affinity sulfate transporter 1